MLANSPESEKMRREAYPLRRHTVLADSDFCSHLDLFSVRGVDISLLSFLSICRLPLGVKMSDYGCDLPPVFRGHVVWLEAL